MADDSESGREIDAVLLRYLARYIGGQDEVEQTSLFPATKQDRLVVAFDPIYYPSEMDGVRLELRVYTNGDFHISYIEEYMGDQRHCRWDRHEQDHSSDDHFHPLPDASTADATDRSYPMNVTTTLRTVVFPWIENRLGTLWGDSHPDSE